MISKEQVEHIAKLARIQLTQPEVERFQKDFTEIVDYFAVLEHIDVSKTEPMTHAGHESNVVRADISRLEDPSVIQKILSQAPELKDGFLKVHSILK